MEIVICYLIHDLGALKACSLTCHSRYTAASPHLHHNLTLVGDRSDAGRTRLEPLYKLHELCLVHLVRVIRVKQGRYTRWFVPQAFSHIGLCRFSALANVHTLKVQNLDIPRFIPGVERHFGQFSQTLRSITLYDPFCTPEQLSHFLSLFSGLDNIGIRNALAGGIIPGTSDTRLVPFSALKLGGRLALYNFNWAETWTSITASNGDLRFRHMDLRGSATCAPVLFKASGETLETLRFSMRDVPAGGWFCTRPSVELH